MRNLEYDINDIKGRLMDLEKELTDFDLMLAGQVSRLAFKLETIQNSPRWQDIMYHINNSSLVLKKGVYRG